MVRERMVGAVIHRQREKARITLGNLIYHLVDDYAIVKVGKVRKGASLGKNNST